MESKEKAVLDKIREWLSNGATIKATDVNSPILDFTTDDKCISNLTISFS